MKLKITYFTFVEIGSERHGGSLCCRNHIKRLSTDTGIELFVVVAGPKYNEIASLSYLSHLGVKGKFIPYQSQKPSFFNDTFGQFFLIPFEIQSRSQPQVDQEVINAIVSNDSEVLLLDYFFSALFCPKAIKIAPKTALIHLNRETEFYIDQLKTGETPYIRIPTRLVSILRLWMAERILLRAISKIIALSPPDIQNPQGISITPFLDQNPMQWIPNNSKTIFFVGNIGHYPNRQAIKYIITKLAPLVAEILPDARFKIIGASDHDVAFHHPSVDLLGVSDEGEVERLFLNCHLFICPIKNTFGLKFKIAKALTYGTPFLASPESMQCIPHIKNIPTISLSDPMQAAKAIAAILLDEKRSKVLAASINSQHSQFIETQKNIWSISLSDTVANR